MKLSQPGAETYIPRSSFERGILTQDAEKRTTHLAVGAHQDDLEIMALHGVLACLGRPDQWFGGVVVTNGGGSPRDGLYADYTDEQMQAVRSTEQKQAAEVGKYGLLALLDHPSSAVKDPANTFVVSDLRGVLLATRPRGIYTHNLADKHDTHVAVALRLIQALRTLPEEDLPREFYGCEVWRDLDWLHDDDKVALDVSGHENLAASLLGIFDSQICGGKRYDLATLGRRRAHASYHDTHGVDVATGLTFAMDLMPFLQNPELDPADFVEGLIARFARDVEARFDRLLPEDRPDR